MLSFRRLLWAMCSMHTLIVVTASFSAIYLATVAPWSDPFFLGGLLVSYLLYYFGVCAKPVQIYCNGGSVWQHSALQRMGCLRGRGYWPTPYLVNANAQTLFAAMGRPSAGVCYQREKVSGVMEDGEVLTLDWSFVPHSGVRMTKEGEMIYGFTSVDHHSQHQSPEEVTTIHRKQQKFGTTGDASVDDLMSPTKIMRGADSPTSASRRRSSKRAATPASPKGGKSKKMSLPPQTVSENSPKMSTKGKGKGKDSEDHQQVQQAPPKAPLIILFHGLTGGSDDTNMHYLTKFFNEKGWHVVIPIRRGCGEKGTITVAKHYAYGDVENTTHVVDFIAEKMEGHPIYACGISAGSNVMCNYLGKSKAHSKILGGVSVANGYEWNQGTAAIAKHHPIWDVVMSSLVNGTLFHRHATVFGATTEPHEAPHPATPVGRGICLPRTSSMREYDEHVSRRLHGFDSLEEFYTHQSCIYRLPAIRVPVMFLNALDDPLVFHQLWPFEQMRKNNYLVLVTTACGGHLGFPEGWWPFSRSYTWMDRFCVEGLEALIEHHSQGKAAGKNTSAPE